MDQNDTTRMTDDQELAKVLESMNETAVPMVTADSPAPTTDPLPTTEVTATDIAALPTDATSIVATDDMLSIDAPTSTPYLESTTTATAVDTTSPTPSLPGADPDPELDSIKKDALEELRPLVDKLDLPPDEKFDTLLLIIRSTDDKALVGAAHEAARAIPDETKRAQALLDVIKEIDYFSGHSPQP